MVDSRVPNVVRRRMHARGEGELKGYFRELDRGRVGRITAVDFFAFALHEATFAAERMIAGTSSAGALHGAERRAFNALFEHKLERETPEARALNRKDFAKLALDFGFSEVTNEIFQSYAAPPSTLLTLLQLPSLVRLDHKQPLPIPRS